MYPVSKAVIRDRPRKKNDVQGLLQTRNTPSVIIMIRNILLTIGPE